MDSRVAVADAKALDGKQEPRVVLWLGLTADRTRAIGWQSFG